MYYLHYEEETSVNYCFLFSLYLLAERNTKERINNIIKYESLSKLSKRIETECNYKISSSTISRILNNSNYNLYLTHNKKDKTIMLDPMLKVINKYNEIMDKKMLKTIKNYYKRRYASNFYLTPRNEVLTFINNQIETSK